MASVLSEICGCGKESIDKVAGGHQSGGLLRPVLNNTHKLYPGTHPRRNRDARGAIPPHNFHK